MTGALRCELAIKHWRRVGKLELIEHQNPEWCDLYSGLI